MVLLGGDSNRDPDRYRANSIHDRYNDNFNNNVDDLTNLGDGYLYHTFRNILSTTTDRLNKCIVPAGSTYINDHSSKVVYLITCNKCKLQYVGETS